MYISELEIDGYKNCNKKSKISFNPGINILVGENASGKTTIIDAIRMILRDSEQGYITENDFYKSFEKDDQKRNILINLKMKKSKLKVFMKIYTSKNLRLIFQKRCMNIRS